MNEKKYLETVEKYASDPRLMQMKKYRQHGTGNTYDHTLNVARGAMKIAKGLRIPVREEEMAAGAMLHDFYLYDIRESGRNAWQHGTMHPAEAVRNSEKYFTLDPLTREIIETHMWPLTLRAVPRSREAVIVCVADKLCSLQETVFMRKK